MQPQITSFLPFLVVFCSDFLETEGHVQWCCGCLVVGMAACTYVSLPGQSCHPERVRPQIVSCFQGRVKATKHFSNVCSQ